MMMKDIPKRLPYLPRHHHHTLISIRSVIKHSPVISPCLLDLSCGLQLRREICRSCLRFGRTNSCCVCPPPLSNRSYVLHESSFLSSALKSDLMSIPPTRSYQCPPLRMVMCGLKKRKRTTMKQHLARQKYLIVISRFPSFAGGDKDFTPRTRAKVCGAYASSRISGQYCRKCILFEAFCNADQSRRVLDGGAILGQSC